MRTHGYGGIFQIHKPDPPWGKPQRVQGDWTGGQAGLGRSSGILEGQIFSIGNVTRYGLIVALVLPVT